MIKRHILLSLADRISSLQMHNLGRLTLQAGNAGEVFQVQSTVGASAKLIWWDFDFYWQHCCRATQAGSPQL